MAKRVQLRRGTTPQTSIFTGAVGEVTVDTDKKTIVVHDGTTVGGTVLAKVSEVPSLVPQATETALGVAKIATTAIAQAGGNDTDIITAKKLRDALNASGIAPIGALRGVVTWTYVSGVLTIVDELNVASVVRVSTGIYRIAPKVAFDKIPSVVGMCAPDTNGGNASAYVVKYPLNTPPTLNEITVVTTFSASVSGVIDPTRTTIFIF